MADEPQRIKPEVNDLRVLIVDDEMYAVMGIKDAIDWQGLGVTDVCEAFNMREAVKILERQPVDVMICDIEMPKGTGIELLEWVNERSLRMETIFLTAHGDFRFMQRAIQLSSFDYIMKPVEFGVLEQTIRKALNTVQKKKAELALTEQYKPYYELWNKKKTLLSEKFWYDLFAGRIGVGLGDEERLPAEYGIAMQADAKLLPVVVSVENWKRELSTRDEEVMEYAIRQSVSEMVVADSSGEVVQTKHGVTVAVLYVSPDEEGTLRKVVGERCGRYIEACSTYLNCSVSCYIGEPVPLRELTPMYKALLALEYNNLSESNQLNWLSKQEAEPAADPRLPDFGAWTLLLENGKAEELGARLSTSLRELAADRRFGASVLQAYYLGFLQMVYYLLQKKGLSAYRLLQDAGVPAEASPRTLEQMEDWGIRIIRTVHRYLFQEESTIERLCAYISEHLAENITREMLAEHVYLNSAYLSRLFKKEKGMSITDYLLQERMRIARDLIESSTLPISDIAQSVGFSNFSYFAKMFKKVHNVNPQQLRKLSGCPG